MSSVSDPRHQSYITYSQEEILFFRILSYCCHFKSMREMNRELNNDNVIQTSRLLFGKDSEEVPHGDTINNYLEEVSINQLRHILREMLRDLMKKKFFDGYKINNKYYHMIIDGVEIFSFKKEKINGSIKKEHADGPRYYTMMLVAVIERDNIVIPIDFEPIENEGLVYDKQDCEQNVAKRLMDRIKKHFKRMEMCVSGDALYFNEPMLKELKDKNWRYIITYKEGRAPSVAEYYKTLEEHNDLNIVEKGRNRWKIENKEFNDLKTKGYNMEHAYSYDENAVKGHFILLMIAHIIMQLMEMYERNKGIFETIHKISQRIKEALRTQPLSASDVLDISTPIHLSRISLQILEHEDIEK